MLLIHSPHTALFEISCPSLYDTSYKKMDKNLQQATIPTSFNNFYGFMRLIWVIKMLMLGKHKELLKRGGLRAITITKANTYRA